MIPPSMLKPPNTVMIKDFEHHKLKLFSLQKEINKKLEKRVNSQNKYKIIKLSESTTLTLHP